MNWQPIETAPENQMVLIWHEAKDCAGLQNAIWPAVLVPDELEGEGWWSLPAINSADDEISCSAGQIKPKFWMPLPDAPA